MGNFNDGKPITESEANKIFWDKVYPAMFCNMNHFKEANKIMDNGSIVGEFLEAVYKVHTPKVNNTEAVFGFAAWLTTRKESITASSKHSAVPWADAVADFTLENGFPDITGNYPGNIVFPESNRVSYGESEPSIKETNNYGKYTQEELLYGDIEDKYLEYKSKYSDIYECARDWYGLVPKEVDSMRINSEPEPSIEKTRVTNAEAIMGFSAWLTTRDEVITASSKHDASQWANAAAEFSKVNGFDEFTRNYPDNLTFPKDNEPVIVDSADIVPEDEKSCEQEPAMPIIVPSKMNMFMKWLNKYAMKVVVYNLKNNKDYRRSWTSSISMAQLDCHDVDTGSELFMDWLTR